MTVERQAYLARRVGIDHVLLGTDMPFDMAMQTPMATLHEAFDDDECARIASANAIRLFGQGHLADSDPAPVSQ